MLHVDDDAFVRAPARLVYPRLTNLAAYREWWPGVDAVRLGGRGAELYHLTVATRPLRRPLRLTVHPHAWRHDAGFHLTLEGDLDGRAEFWLEEGFGGTVVHHLASFAAVDRSARIALADYRRAIRRGFWAFKDHVQTDVRATAGVAP